MNPKNYIPFTQQKFCCVAASLQSVLERRGFKLIAQEELAAKLGLIVPKEDKRLLPLARTGHRPPAGWGTQIDQPEYSPNTVFEALGYPITLRIVKPKDVDDLQNMLQTIQASDNDALLCFDYGVLWGTDFQGGHVCVFSAIDGDRVTLIDPERNVPKFREVTVAQLLKAMDFHGEGNSTGVWIIESKESTL